MQTLVIAATEMEISPFLKACPDADHLITGIGVPAALYQIQKRLHQIDYDLVIQAGIAGAYSAGPKPGELVLVAADRFADMGVLENGVWYSYDEKGLSAAGAFPFSDGWLMNPDLVSKRYAWPMVKAITVNMLSDDKDWNNRFQQKYHAAIETMEGAALHFVCLQEQVPFLQLRAISNIIGERDKLKWEMEKAISVLNKNLIALYLQD